MTISSLKITNILSFECLEINSLKDMNCIVGKNNVGKSNLLKCLKFFYGRLEGKEELPPKLYSNYSYKGSISITFDTSRIFSIARKYHNNDYFSFIMRKLIPLRRRLPSELKKYNSDKTTFTLSLSIYNDATVKWSTQDKQTRNIILYLYPFFYIESRHMDLHKWDCLWDLIARLKSFNLSKIDNELVIDFFDKSINSKGDNSYRSYIEDIEKTISTRKSTHKERILSYIKAGLNGYKFEINENDLIYQSDGTNSYHFIKTFLNILIVISRREYITPFVFIDEPELGLHPKMNEILIDKIYEYYKYKDDLTQKVVRPKVFLTTHSPNVVKEVIKKFRLNQNVFCFKKASGESTTIRLLDSIYNSESFINIFSDNEARLFFSNFILFVEGETELEVFGNMKLLEYFPHLKMIDIYKSSSNVISERINPSSSNSAIPYLFLFDADKACEFAFSIKNNTITLKGKKNGGLFSIKKNDLIAEENKYKVGFNRKYSDIAKNINKISKYIEEILDLDLTKQICEHELLFNEFLMNVNIYLSLKKCYINKTTFEGCLIQEDSARIFYKWLHENRGIKMSPIVNRVSDSKFLTESMLVDYMRVIFNGKTKIFTDYKSFNLDAYNQAINDGKDPNKRLLRTSKRAKVLMNMLEEKTLKNSFLKKTDGWATSFLNFAIKEIESESKEQNKTFRSIFKVYFPELYDIIYMLQPDSRGEV